MMATLSCSSICELPCGLKVMAYMTDEAQEGRDQFLEKRDPDWSPYPWYY